MWWISFNRLNKEKIDKNIIFVNAESISKRQNPKLDMKVCGFLAWMKVYKDNPKAKIYNIWDNYYVKHLILRVISQSSKFKPVVIVQMIRVIKIKEPNLEERIKFMFNWMISFCESSESSRALRVFTNEL
jgi:hypothetical protein